MQEMTVGPKCVAYITYSIVDSAGNVVEQHDMPIGFIAGGQSGLLEKIEQALLGQPSGTRLEVSLSPEDAFGERDPDLTYTDQIDNVPPEYRRLGAEVVFSNEAGETRSFYVTHVDDTSVTVDGNHPMAGQTVTCVVNVVNVREATPQELAAGLPADGGSPLLQ